MNVESSGYILTALAVLTLAASLVTAGLYAWDKRAARMNRRRVPERTLLIGSLIGGWPGGLIAGRMLRHKTAKRSYRIQFAACAALHAILTATFAYLMLR